MLLSLLSLALCVMSGAQTAKPVLPLLVHHFLSTIKTPAEYGSTLRT